MSLAAYVAEDGHHWEERPLALQRLYAPIQGNTRARKREWVGWGAGLGRGRGGVVELGGGRILGALGIAFEM